MILPEMHPLVSTNSNNFFHETIYIFHLSAMYLTFEFPFPVSDLGHPGQRSVGGHVSQREAAALVSEDFQRLSEHTL